MQRPYEVFKVLLIPFILLVVGGAAAAAAPASPEPMGTRALASDQSASAAVPERDWGKSPIVFEANAGQVDERAAFVVRATDKSLFFEDDGITFALTAPADPESAEPPARWATKLRFLGARPVKPEGLDRQDMVVSHFSGSPEEWITGVPTYSRILYRNLWDGIDLEYHGTADALKYTLYVAPGADPSQIRLAYDGADMRIEPDGRLAVDTPVAGFHDAVPTSYQVDDEGRVDVATSYAVVAGSADDVATFGFDLGSYDTTLPLVIDPAIIVYCGYISGSYATSGTGIAVDTEGSAYVTGWLINQAGLPAAVGPATTFGGNADAFVVKVKADGTGFDYAGFIGGPDYEEGAGIEVDAEGNAYVAGNLYDAGSADGTAKGFPVVGGPDLTFNGGGYDMWVAKVAADGTHLNYAGFVGGSGWDQFQSEQGGSPIAVDADGAVYLTGLTGSTDHPAALAAVGVDHSTLGSDAFVVKLAPDGTGFEYGTYIGGSQPDVGKAVAVDDAGNAYVVGTTFWNWEQPPGNFPTVVGPGLGVTIACPGCGTNGFITKVTADGTAFEYSGFIGGVGSTRPLDVAVDSEGSAYVVGDTSSTQSTFPDGNGFGALPGFDRTHSGSMIDAFLVKVKPVPAGPEPIEYATYLGGYYINGTTASSVEVNPAGEATVAGWTTSDQNTGFPVLNGPDPTYNGGSSDGFVTGFTADGTQLRHSGFLGGSGSVGYQDKPFDLALDAGGNIYVAGTTFSTDHGSYGRFPVSVGPRLSFVYPSNGPNSFVAKIGLTSPPCALDLGGVAWWRGENSANPDTVATDVVGGLHGSYGWEGITPGPGMVGRGYQFAGAGFAHYMIVNHDSRLDIGGPGFTVEFWMKGNKDQTSPQVSLVDKSQGIVDSTGWLVSGTNATGKVRFSIGAGGPGNTNLVGVESGIDVLDGAFHHISGTWDGADVRLYVDGVLQGSAPLTTPFNNSRTLYFGTGWGKERFRGTLDEISLYSRALSAAEISSIVNSGGDGKCTLSAIQPPTAEAGGPYPVSEGGSVTLDGSGSSHPTGETLTFAWDLDNNGSYETPGVTALFSAAALDGPSTATVGLQVCAGDDNCATDTATVIISNLPPNISELTNDGPIPEGSSATITAVASDPAGAADPLAYFFDCDDDGSFEIGPQAGGSAACLFTDNGGFEVNARVDDGDGGSHSRSTTVTVHNVAPTADFQAPAVVDEGDDILLALLNSADPSSVDLAAGLQYAFDCGDGAGYGPFGPAGSTSCATDDDGVREVKGKVRDKDGGQSEYTASVTVRNLPPEIAAVTNDGPIDEGGAATITVEASDPAGAADPLSYAFDCDDDGTFEIGPQAGSSAGCTFDDNGDFTVNVRVSDGDGGTDTASTTVTVRNVAPSATFNAQMVVDQGTAIELSLTDPSDPSGPDTAAGFEYAFDCGDGSGYGPFGPDSTKSCPTTSSGSRDVGGKIRDKDYGEREYTAHVTINNKPPTITAVTNDGPIDEGASATITVEATDLDALTYAFDCDDDGDYEVGPQAGASAACAFDDNGGYPVNVRVADSEGGYATGSTTVAVSNVAPTATFHAPAAADEGSSFELSLTDPSDPSAADTTAGFTYAFDCGDGGGYGPFGASNTASCPTSDDDVRTVMGKVRDKDGGQTAYSAQVVIRNVAPTVVAVSNSSPIDEGQSATISITAGDLAGAADPLAYAFDCDDDGSYELGPQAANSASCAFADNGAFEVNVRVSDGDGGADTASTTVTVRNVAPSVTSISLPLDPHVINTPVAGTATFTDPGVLDTHTAVWSWGDGGSSAGTITEAGGSGTTGGSHSYTTPGIYLVKVTVTDKDGDSGELTFQYYIVIYDPDGGFVTGGGWFNSPAGAYAPNPSLTGKANFGFVAKYLPGRTVPDGDTEFQFKAGNLNFKSRDYEWLTVGGARAQFKGTGTINGSGSYRFFVTAIDGQQPGGGNVDKLRIRIWNDAGGGLVYDNQMSAPDDADPTTAIGGGSIVIHKP